MIREHLLAGGLALLLLLFGVHPGFAQRGEPAGARPAGGSRAEGPAGKKPAPTSPKMGELRTDPALHQILKNSPSQKEFPRASAVILADESAITFGEDRTFTNTEHRLVKVLTPQGLQRFSELRIPYSSATQKVRIEEARVMRSDGRLIPVPKDAIQEVAPPATGAAQAFANLRVLVVQFPGLDANGLMEYKITIEDKSGLRPLLGHDLYLQDTEPILEGKVTVSVPKGKTLRAQGINVGKLTPEVRQEGNRQISVWTYKNIPPFLMEPSMPAAKDFVGRLVLGLADSWDAAAAELGQVYLSKIPAGKEIEPALKEAVREARDADDKLRKVYAYVAGVIRTMPVDLGKIGLAPQGTAALLKDKVGDAKDKVALLIGMLKGIGVEAQPVLLSSRGNGRLAKDVPAVIQFNHVAVWVPSKQLWLDPASETAPAGYLPPDLQGVEGIVLSGEKSAFVTTPVFTAGNNKEEIAFVSKLLPDATLETELALKEHGANGLFIRNLLRGVKPQERVMALEALASQITPRFQITSSYLSPVEDLNAPMEMKVAFQGKNYAMPAGDLLIFPLPVLTTSRLEEQIRTLSLERKYPFVVGQTIQEEKSLDLAIPQGYRIRVVPKGDEVTTSVGSYKAVVTAAEGKLAFKSSFIVNKVEVTAEELGGLRRLVEARAQMEREKIVLEKVK